MSPQRGTALDRTTRVRRTTEVLATEVDGEMVMMDIDKGLYFGLDPVGTAVWKRLDEPTTAAELVDGLVLEYDADAATIERDVLALLTSLTEQGLLEIC